MYTDTKHCTKRSVLIYWIYWPLEMELFIRSNREIAWTTLNIVLKMWILN